MGGMGPMSEEEIVEALNEIAARFREQRLYGYKHVVNAVALIVQQQAQIARVRELADTWMSDGAAWGPYSARCILDALDGGCPTCEGPIRETVGLVCQTCGTDYGAQGDSDE